MKQTLELFLTIKMGNLPPYVLKFFYSEMQKVGDKIEYDPKKELGRGAFGIVYEGLLEGSRIVAVKRILNDYVKQASLIKNEQENETKIMFKARDHRNILCYIYCETDEHFL